MATCALKVTPEFDVHHFSCNSGKRIDQDRLTESFYFPPCVCSGISAALNCSENLCSPFSSRATWTRTPRLFSSGAWRSLAGCSLSSITLLFQQSSVLSCPALPSMGKELFRRKWLCCSIILCLTLTHPSALDFWVVARCLSFPRSSSDSCSRSARSGGLRDSWTWERETEASQR